MAAPGSHQRKESGGKRETTEYSFRQDLLHGPTSFRLEDEGIAMAADKGKNLRFRYSDVTEVNVAYMMQGTYRCIVKAGKAKMIWGSKSIKSFGNFEDQLPEFGEFLIALHHRLKPHFPRIRFTKGNAALFYIMAGLAVCIPGLFVFAIVGVAVTGRTPPLKLIMSLVGIGALFALVCVPTALMSRPKPYNPARHEYPYDFRP